MKQVVLILWASLLVLNTRAQEYHGVSYTPTQISPEEIDTLWLFPPEFRIGTIDDNGLRDHSLVLSNKAADSLRHAFGDFRKDTVVEVIPDKFVRYNVEGKICSFDSLRTKEMQDSILTFYHRIFVKHTSKKKPMPVPDYFFRIMDSSNMEYAAIVYGTGFIKTKAQYKQEVIAETVKDILLAAGGMINFGSAAVQYESLMTIVILERKSRKVVFVGTSYYPIPPASYLSLHFQLHYILDPFFGVPLSDKPDKD